MKQILVIISICIIGILKVDAQSVYYMYSHQSGGGEYIDNLKNIDDLWGIRFTSGSKTRGYVDSDGRWVFINNNSIVTSPTVLSNYLKSIPSATMGVSGFLVTEGIVLKDKFGLTSSCELDINPSLTGATISTKGDIDGLSFSSQSKKIYLLGKTGIGFNDAEIASQLHVKGGYITNEGGGIQTVFGVQTQTNRCFVGTSTANGMFLGANYKRAMYIDTNGRVFAGFVDGNLPTVRNELLNKYDIFVKKGILSEDYGIAPVASWADFVFAKDYNLAEISEVESFIEKNNHLPDVPSAQQVAEEGYSQHDMNKILLQKIEELTLYTIQQQKEIDALKTQLQESKK